LARICCPGAVGVEPRALEDLSLRSAAGAIQCVAVIHLCAVRLVKQGRVDALAKEKEVEDEEVEEALDDREAEPQLGLVPVAVLGNELMNNKRNYACRRKEAENIRIKVARIPFAKGSPALNIWMINPCRLN
jgi:hypothetical protein